VHILLVEDQAMVLDVVRRMLHRRGHRVTAHPSAEAALAWLDGGGEPIDLIITDVLMPGIDGVEMVRRIHAARPNLPALFMSAYSTHVFDDALPGPLLSKPFDQGGLDEALARVLAMARNQPITD